MPYTTKDLLLGFIIAYILLMLLFWIVRRVGDWFDRWWIKTFEEK